MNFFNTILDLLYPRFCYWCMDRVDKPGLMYLCSRCVLKAVLTGDKICPICGRPGYIDICPFCNEKRPAYKTARSAGLYEGILKEGIHRLKYSGHRHLVPTLAGFLIQAYDKEPRWHKNIDIIIPVPMDKARKRERGFNQTELLAGYLSKKLSIPYDSRILRKAKKTLPQVNLTRGKRLVNLTDAFYSPAGISISGKRILLIDDVYTTGATVTECAKTLLFSGAEEVNILTLARGA